MSNDHKPVNKGRFPFNFNNIKNIMYVIYINKLNFFFFSVEESDRITKAGGFVEFGRVNGMILFIVLKIVFYLWFYSD